MDRIDIRDQILRTFKDKGFDEQNCGFFKEEDIIEIAETIVKNLPIQNVISKDHEYKCKHCGKEYKLWKSWDGHERNCRG